jgi:Arc/MetJ family transcription regulator
MTFAEVEMRTTIVLDDELVKRAQELTGIRTKKGVVTEGLKLLVRIEEQKKLRELYGQIEWEGDLETMREERGGDAGS